MLAATLCAVAGHWHPTCTASLTPSVCVHGERIIQNCTRVDHTRPSKTGAWVLDDSQPYFIDRGLVGGLARFFGNASVNEFGAGKGCYSDALSADGVNAHPFEGAMGIEAHTQGFVRHADMTTVGLSVGRRDWVLCLEMAEHVPKQHEATMLANLDRHNRKGIVLSWSSAKAGVGHVNPQPASYVTHVMKGMNYTEDADAGRALRAAVSMWSWFRTTANHGRDGGGVRVWRRQRSAEV